MNHETARWVARVLYVLVAAQSGLTIGLTLSLVFAYSRSPKLKHLLLVASSYLLLVGLSLYGVVTRAFVSDAVYVLLALAYVLGDVGLYVLLVLAPHHLPATIKPQAKA